MPDSNVRYVGLDVHKRVATICIIDSAGKVVLQQNVAVERGYLLSLAQNVLLPTDRLALEATTNSWAVQRLLAPFVAEVVVSNPLATKAIAQSKIKTDKVDSHVLAQLLRCDYLPKVWQPDERTSLLRELTGRRAAMVGQRTLLRNRIHSVLAMRLIVEPKGDLFGCTGREWLNNLCQGDGIDSQGRQLIEADLRLLEALDQELRRLESELARRGYEDQRIKLLITLPGVDVTVAQAVLAAFGDITRFADADKAAGYLGLAPSTHQSGDRCYHGPITKRGNSRARWMLIQAAHAVRLNPGPLGHFFHKLAKKKNHNVAVVATARKLAVIAWHMLTRNEPYRYATPMATANKLAKLRTRATGEKRKRGPKPGTRSERKLPEGGSRTVKALATIYAEENLPATSTPTPGEQRAIQATGTEDYVASLATQQVRPRKSRAAAKPTQTVQPPI